MKLLDQDPWLKPYEERIKKRALYSLSRERSLTQGGDLLLSEFADGHRYYGLHHREDGSWVIREFLPNATEVYLIGDFNSWRRMIVWGMKRINDYGDWEINIAADKIKHGDHYKLFVVWPHGSGERIPAWATRVVQDPRTAIFSAQVWAPAKPYTFHHLRPTPKAEPLLIYECHVGMSGEEEGISTYNDFRLNVLPRIAKSGYNAVQVMAVQEHPYYGSFGYHVSSFFAPSSRFGTPDELKQLIDEAHALGIRVIMDLVHSHAVRNEVEGLGNYDGTRTLFFHGGERGEHPAWDSLCFDYGRNNVMHFLLSNCKYWLEEFQFDGFRFDGVSSMLYYNHGLGQTFTGYGDYFNGHQDADAIAYLTIANKLIHELYPNAITIAEEVSGMPGIASKIENGGMGFDYRLAMNIPDYWIKTIKELPDERWNPGDIWYQLTNRRKEEKTISYAESHDQALVGDKTLLFRLADAEMYWHMERNDRNFAVDRGIALVKMIKLVTAATMNGGYLNFMGNEFGHPEWIDFPREGNGWSYKHARRQWQLADDKNLKYNCLYEFDRDMIALFKSVDHFEKNSLEKTWDSREDQILCFKRGNLVFVFNFHPDSSFTDYPLPLPAGKYKVVMNTDNPEYCGFGLTDDSVEHFTIPDVDENGKAIPGQQHINLYIPSRSAQVLRLED